MSCEKMTISHETLVTNYILNVFLASKKLKKALIEYTIVNSDRDHVKPDIFLSMIENDDIICYLLFELKSRKVLPDLERIEEQYKKYKQVNYKNLDTKDIPAVDVPILINYWFFKTLRKYISQISGILESEDALIFEYKYKKIRLDKNSDSNINQNYLQLLENNVENSGMWSTLLVPFLPFDVTGIVYETGSAFPINIDLRSNINILLAELILFVEHLKYTKKSSFFGIHDWFDYIFQYIDGLCIMGKEDKKSTIRSLRNFLNIVIELCQEESITFVSKTKNREKGYHVDVRKTKNLRTSRLSELKEEIFEKLEEHQKQQKLDSYMK
ncbi:MAG: hypothetical protein GF364_19310 [Candidatus Lokiarchaeota archaeon]|nr:hypothetical protein [Candidatus Lokiarchaeota archaeon]